MKYSWNSFFITIGVFCPAIILCFLLIMVYIVVKDFMDTSNQIKPQYMICDASGHWFVDGYRYCKDGQGNRGIVYTDCFGREHTDETMVGVTIVKIGN